ncbi:putative outer membrane starch-binding protein [Pedobacter psychrotolerans]|uniref:Membrane protein n=1 Tax=Pedobacter psychrotolerans TaxID=1843235 RepID=A0A4R2HHG6_9SPHI|nr:RagB/SusD family nutrient uptake outer membrane protein [Pedobacter psychrotolerans]TCO27116.1 putative outer membrane starch-binding protein [Pedobacter psychrotolerans]GGE59011.1 membrane protein [Pedobacter psychrotolerans]
MKKYILIAALGTTICFSACKKEFLQQDNPNAVTVDNYFKTENDVLLAVNGAYQAMRSSNTIGENSGLFTDERSDDTGRNDNQSNAGEPFQFNDFSLLPSNSYLKTHWLALYNSIARTNVILSNIDKVSFANPATKTNYIAEAKFVRAIMYFELVRKWGPVPLVTKQLVTTDEVTAATFRVPEADVYNQIVADLKDGLSSTLPNFQPTAGIGRASKAAINAYLGKVYLTMAATLANNKAENLGNANTYLLAAYNMKTFGNLSEIPYADVFDVNKKTTCKELIFQIANKQGDVNYSSSIAANNQAKGETINSLKVSTGIGGNVTLDLINEYEASDLRKDFSVKYANDPIVKDWFITKFRDASSLATANGYGGNDWILMRYADVILMLAEVNMLQGNDAAAIQYLDMVRTRAGMPTYAVSRANAAYATAFPTLKLALLHERRVEFAFEHQRWFDLIRNFTATELATYLKAKPQSSFGIAKLANVTTKDRFFPIPFDEVKLDPAKMYQNPGY